MNKSILIGRLTRDPDLKYIPSGEAVANFTLAVDRPFANKAGEKEADFIPIVVWKKQAENCAKYLTKGSQAAVEGRIQVRSWEKDGKRQYMTEVVADRVEFLSKSQKAPEEYQGREVSYDEEDIPF